MADLHRSPRRGMSLDLAALDRKLRFGRSLVAHDQLELGAEHVVHHGRIDRHRRADAGAGQCRLRYFMRVGEGLHLRGVPHEHHVHQRIDAADPVELGGLEAHARRAELLVKRRGRRADRRCMVPSLGGDVVDVVDARGSCRRPACSSARRRIAGNVLAEMARHQPGIDVVRCRPADSR